MSTRQWIIDNLSASGVAKWGAALILKFAIEAGLSAFLAGVITALLYAILIYTPFSIPYQQAGPVALWILLSGAILKWFMWDGLLIDRSD